MDTTLPRGGTKGRTTRRTLGWLGAGLIAAVALLGPGAAGVRADPPTVTSSSTTQPWGGQGYPNPTCSGTSNTMLWIWTGDNPTDLVINGQDQGNGWVKQGGGSSSWHFAVAINSTNYPPTTTDTYVTYSGASGGLQLSHCDGSSTTTTTSQCQNSTITKTVTNTTTETDTVTTTSAAETATVVSTVTQTVPTTVTTTLPGSTQTVTTTVTTQQNQVVTQTLTQPVTITANGQTITSTITQPVTVTVSGAVEGVTGSKTSAQVLGATGTPGATLPPTNTSGGTGSGTGTATSLILLVLAAAALSATAFGRLAARARE